jgi:hypothetical protein
VELQAEIIGWGSYAVSYRFGYQEL